MSRHERRANERRLRKALRKISLAAGEGVGRAVAFSFALASNAVAAEPKKEDTFELPPVVVQDQNSSYVVPQLYKSTSDLTVMAKALVVSHC